MERAEDPGVWTAFVTYAREGDLYKYCITGADGQTVWKADPYGYASELRPGSASRIVDLSRIAWHDDAWMARRTRNFDRPLSIY